MSAAQSDLSPKDSGVTMEAAASTPTVAPSWAVVSFQFEDAGWCDWLYREFDGERVPRPLLRRSSRFGVPYPERLSISPDPADPTQLESYADCLQSSRHLIVVVSPTSGKSPTLVEHLREFRAAGGEERIIALIVKGEPASPSAEAGVEADKGWLPEWLDGRFENNRFRSGRSTEPLVVDARLGIASLAEARARIMAALLEVDQEALNELGIVTRPTTRLSEFPLASRLGTVLAPTPSDSAFVEIADESPRPSTASSFAAWAMGGAALAALGVLSFWPTNQSAKIPPSQQKAIRADSDASMGENMETVVEDRPIFTGGLPVPTPPADPEVASPAPPVAVTQSEAVAANPDSNSPLIESLRLDLIARRDQLTKLAESRMAEEFRDEAMDLLDHAVDLGQQIADDPAATASDFVELSALHRRAGTLAEELSQTLLARTHYESGKRALLNLREKESLPEEAIKLLADLETRLRQEVP